MKGGRSKMLGILGIRCPRRGGRNQEGLHVVPKFDSCLASHRVTGPHRLCCRRVGSFCGPGDGPMQLRERGTLRRLRE